MSPSHGQLIYRYLWNLGKRQLLDASSNPVDTGPPKTGSWSFNDNVKVLIIILTVFYVGFFAYLFYSTYQTLLKYEVRLDALVGNEKLKEIKERERLDKAAFKRNQLLLIISGKPPDRVPPEEPPRLISAQAERILGDFFDESKTVDATSKPKKKKLKGWKRIAM